MDQIQEFFAVLSEEQKYTLIIAVVAILFVLFKVAKAVIRLAVIAAIVILAAIAYNKFEPSGIEKFGKKVKHNVESSIN
ncbi:MULTISPECIES: hypothetical protein [Flammeovirga]|uniref:Uncharacterized protein n=1 Tax=Flammeovirga agarivorans TaxID=2726742 RepID=A0A7X8XUV9_9BACT|nr:MULTISPECIES: hypothetical protein [Flammeovirga]NLR90721.1 hypothetical protein [Flammeovirga agarivorans]